MREEIRHFAAVRSRSQPWWTDQVEADIAKAEIHQEYLPGRDQVLVDPLEVVILATMAASDARPISIHWLSQYFDEGLDRHVTYPEHVFGAAVVSVRPTGIVVVDPLTLSTHSLRPDVVYGLEIMDKPKRTPKDDEAQAQPLAVLA